MNIAAIEAYIALIGPILDAVNKGISPLVAAESADIQAIWTDAQKAGSDFMTNLQGIIAAVKAIPKP